MKSLQSVLIAVPLASALMFAQQASPDPKPQADTPSQTESSRQEARAPGQADASNSRTYIGTIVSANCSQASALTGSNFASYADRSAAAPSASAPSADSTINKNPKSVYDLQQDVLKHCPASSKVDSFALVTDDGRFLKLDDAGNTQVKSSAAKTLKNMKVSIAGSVEGDTLKVQSLTKT